MAKTRAQLVEWQTRTLAQFLPGLAMSEKVANKMARAAAAIRLLEDEDEPLSMAPPPTLDFDPNDDEAVRARAEAATARAAERNKAGSFEALMRGI